MWAPMSFVVTVLLLLALQAAWCQLPDNTAAFDPALGGTVVPEDALQAQAATAPALDPLQLANNIMANVEQDKAMVKQALANPAAAFAKYMSEWESGVVSSASVPVPGSASDRRTLRQREQIFKNNLRRYDRLNARSPFMAHGITQFSHLTQAEFKALMLVNFSQLASTPSTVLESGDAAPFGRKLQQQGCSTPEAANTYASISPMPSSVDWVSGFNTGLSGARTPPIRDQGSTCRSCSLFSACAIAEICFIKKNRLVNSTARATDCSEQELLDCSINVQECSEGAWAHDYTGKLACQGMAREVDCKYVGRDRSGSWCKTYTTRPKAMNGWSRLPVNNSLALTQALSQTAAVVYVDANSWGSYSSGVMPCAKAGVNHAVTAVGYYNALPVAGIVMDYWVIRNSWATTWGAGNSAAYRGYAFIRKDCSSPGGAYSILTSAPVVPLGCNPV